MIEKRENVPIGTFFLFFSCATMELCYVKGRFIMYRVLIVDDQQSSRELMCYAASERENYQVVGALEDAYDAIDFCKNNSVDLILMDIYTAKKENGIEVSKIIKENNQNIKIIIVTFLVAQEHIDKAREYGLEGFWYKDHNDQKLVDVMNLVMEGNIIYPDSLPNIVVGLAKASEFTKQELVVLKHIINGYQYSEICQMLNITRSTLNYHIANLKSKTGYESILKLAVDVAMQKFIIAESNEIEL